MLIQKSIKFIKSINYTPIIYLGRWNLESNIKNINRKIDLANEDHCGCCDINFNNNKIIYSNNIDKDDDYYKPFFY